jgi:hypothetical protein
VPLDGLTALRQARVHLLLGSPQIGALDAALEGSLLLGAEHLVIQFLHDLSELRLQVLDRLELNSAAHGDFYVCAVSIDACAVESADRIYAFGDFSPFGDSD